MTGFAAAGWERIPVRGRLLETVEELFWDLCAYCVLIAEDSGMAGLKDLGRLRESIGVGTPADAEPLLQSLLLEIGSRDRKLLGRLYDIGTRPMRLLAGRRMLFADELEEVLRRFFHVPGRRPLLAAPQNGETLHVFPPGAENFKYNLPVHQDYPYLLQSSRQLTFWLSLTRNAGGEAGGIRIFPGTHRHGIAKTFRSAHGHYEVATAEYADFDPADHVDSCGELFELYAIDSLAWHASLRNASADQIRLTYIFRISDLSDPGRVRFGVDRMRQEVDSFEAHHPDRFLDDRGPS